MEGDKKVRFSKKSNEVIIVMAYIPRLKQEYKRKVIPALTEEFGYKNVMQVPKLKKIVLSKGVGDAVADKKLIDHAVEELTTITGQKAFLQFLKRMLHLLNYVKECQLVLKLLYEVKECMNS